jgi:hypothetical protein
VWHGTASYELYTTEDQTTAPSAVLHMRVVAILESIEELFVLSSGELLHSK